MSNGPWVTIAAVIDGAVVGGCITYGLEWRRERAHVNAVARVLLQELEEAGTSLQSAVAYETWWRFLDLRVDDWDENNAIVAGALTTEHWISAKNTISNVHLLNTAMWNSNASVAVALVDAAGGGLPKLRAGH